MLELRNLRIVDEKWCEPCTLNQQQASARLEITERYLRELDQYFPPRTQSGSGFESEYLWPATLFWFLEFQVAQEIRKRDEWAFQQWWDKVHYMRQLRIAESRLNTLLSVLRKHGAPKAVLDTAQRVLSDS